MWPFKKREDWRDTGEEEWRTVSVAGNYAYQVNAGRQVRFPDGAERWATRHYEFGVLDRTIRRELA